MSPPADEIPVLTDVIVAGQVPQQTAPPVRTQRPGSLDAAEWATLEGELREAVLVALQGRIDVVIDQRIRETLNGLVERLSVNLTTEMKVTLRDTVRDVVQRAVAQEVARVRATGPR